MGLMANPTPCGSTLPNHVRLNGDEFPTGSDLAQELLGVYSALKKLPVPHCDCN